MTEEAAGGDASPDREREAETATRRLEQSLQHILRDRSAAVEIARRNYSDLGQFGAGAILRSLPAAVRRTLAVRLDRRRRKRHGAGVVKEINRSLLDASPGIPWEHRASLPVARFEPRAVTVEDRLYVLGGFHPPREQLEGSSWSYHPGSDRWVELPPMPVPVTHSGSVAANGRIWMIGGFAGDNPGLSVRHVQIFDPGRDEWIEGPALPFHMASAAAAVVGSRIHIIGGLAPDRRTDVFDHLVIDAADPMGHWSDLAPLPPPGRNHHAAAALGGKLYVFGGHSGHDGDVSDQVASHVYDPVSDRWERIADLLESRHHCEASTFVWDDKIVIAGGLAPGRVGPLPDLVAYAPASDSWQRIGLLPVPRWGAAVQKVGDALVLTAGSGRTHHHASAETWLLPLEPGQITGPQVDGG